MRGPTPAQPYQADDLQTAYERGFEQMYEHDSFVFIDRLDAMVNSLADAHVDREEAALRAAALDGAADALRALGARMCEAAQ